MPTLQQILYDSGDFFMPKCIKDKLETYIIGNDKSLFYVNYWSFVHMFSGVLSGLLYIYFGYSLNAYNYFYTMLIIHTLWEIWQILIGMSDPLELRRQIDILVDTLFFISGAILVFYIFKYI